jgi:hypothetical protein
MIAGFNYPPREHIIIIGSAAKYMVRLNPEILNLFVLQEFTNLVKWDSFARGRLLDIDELDSIFLSTRTHPSFKEGLMSLFTQALTQNDGDISIGDQSDLWSTIINNDGEDLWNSLLSGQVYFAVTGIDRDGDFATNSYDSGTNVFDNDLSADLLTSQSPRNPIYIPQWLIDEFIETPIDFIQHSWKNDEDIENYPISSGLRVENHTTPWNAGYRNIGFTGYRNYRNNYIPRSNDD